jgi:hypothetical protein
MPCRRCRAKNNHRVFNRTVDGGRRQNQTLRLDFQLKSGILFEFARGLRESLNMKEQAKEKGKVSHFTKTIYEFNAQK